MAHTTTPAVRASSDSFALWSDVSAAALVASSTMATSPTSGPTVFAAYAPTPAAASPTPYMMERSYETSAPNVSNYPKLIKMVEKRKPVDPAVSGYVQPYCQKMQILWDWNIVPIETVPIIPIQEVQYTVAPTTSTSSPNPIHRMMRHRSKRDAVTDLESFCICQWTSQ